MTMFSVYFILLFAGFCGAKWVVVDGVGDHCGTVITCGDPYDETDPYASLCYCKSLGAAVAFPPAIAEGDQISVEADLVVNSPGDRLELRSSLSMPALIAGDRDLPYRTITRVGVVSSIILFAPDDAAAYIALTISALRFVSDANVGNFVDVRRLRNVLRLEHVEFAGVAYGGGGGSEGGAVHFEGDGVGELQIVDSVFLDVKTGAGGGGVLVQNAATVEITRANFTKCEAVSEGGAVSMYNVNNASITDSIFEQNVADAVRAARGCGGALHAASTKLLSIVGGHFALNRVLQYMDEEWENVLFGNGIDVCVRSHNASLLQTGSVLLRGTQHVATAHDFLVTEGAALVYVDQILGDLSVAVEEATALCPTRAGLLAVNSNKRLALSVADGSTLAAVGASVSVSDGSCAYCFESCPVIVTGATPGGSGEKSDRGSSPAAADSGVGGGAGGGGRSAGAPTIAIVAAAGGVTVVLAVCVLMACIWLSRKRKRRRARAGSGGGSDAAAADAARRAWVPSAERRRSRQSTARAVAAADAGLVHAADARRSRTPSRPVLAKAGSRRRGGSFVGAAASRSRRGTVDAATTATGGMVAPSHQRQPPPPSSSSSPLQQTYQQTQQQLELQRQRQRAGVYDVAGAGVRRTYESAGSPLVARGLSENSSGGVGLGSSNGSASRGAGDVRSGNEGYRSFRLAPPLQSNEYGRAGLPPPRAASAGSAASAAAPHRSGGYDDVHVGLRDNGGSSRGGGSGGGGYARVLQRSPHAADNYDTTHASFI